MASRHRSGAIDPRGLFADRGRDAFAAILMPMIDTCKPAVYFPAHHEEEVGGNIDRATEPMFQYIKNKYPGTLTISKEFREPTCFDTRFNIRNGNASKTVVR